MNADLYMSIQTRLDAYKGAISELERSRTRHVIPLARTSLRERLSLAWKIVRGADAAILLPTGKMHG